MVKSTITDTQANLIKNFKTETIIKRYQKELFLDVSEYFTTENISLYLCSDTGYQFFYPDQLSGDNEFYKQLQKFDWYYISWKWEHEIAWKYVIDATKILEIGCGQGGFIEKVSQKKGKEIVGLEMNDDAVKNLSEKGFQVFNLTIQEYSKHRLAYFDLVCSFQVLEHIYNIKEFINGVIDSVREGGKLIIAVPNNESFIKIDEGGILNFPPHHMGWWNKTSLINLGNNFGLEIVDIYFEPLQDYHKEWYLSLIGKKYFSFIKGVSLFYEKVAKPFIKILLKYKIIKPKGHSILVVYKKNK